MKGLKDVSLGFPTIDGYDFVVSWNYELVKELNKIRKAKGMKDLSTSKDNGVSYMFYVIEDCETTTLHLIGKVLGSKEDRDCDYEIELTEEEHEILTWKAIEELQKAYARVRKLGF